MSESAAVVILRQELDTLGGCSAMSSLSIRVKWGQGDLSQLGSFRKFVLKYPEVFSLDGNTVKLCNYVPKPKAADASAEAKPVEAAGVEEATVKPPKAPSTATAPAARAPVVPPPPPAPSLPKKRPFPESSDDGDRGSAAEEAPFATKARTMAPPSGPGLPTPKMSPGVGSKAKTEGVPPQPPPPAPVGASGPGKGSGKSLPTSTAPPRKRPIDEAAAEEDGNEEAPTSTGATTQESTSSPGAAPKSKFPNVVTPPPPYGGKGAVGIKAAHGQNDKGGYEKGGSEKGGSNGFGKPAVHGETPRRPEASKGVVPKGAGKEKSQEKAFDPSRPRTWDEDTLASEELQRTIADCKAKGIELELNALAKRIAPSEEHTRACQKILALLRTAASHQWPPRKGSTRPMVEAGGAAAQGTDIDGSELDILLRLDANLSFEERETGVRELRERLRKPPASNFITERDGLQLYPHASCPLSIELKLQGVSNQSAVAHVLLADMPANAKDKPDTLDDIVRKLCDVTEQSRDLVRLVKMWATNHGLCGHHDGHMNGVAWTVIAIYYLQTKQLVPPLAQLSAGDAPPLAGKPQPLALLLRGFFEFLAGRNPSSMRGLSVTKGQEFEVPTPESGGTAAPLFLEDPAAMQETGEQRSLVENLAEPQWARVCEEAKKAAERLAARPQRWFHWAEIFDPRVVPADKIQRLMPLAEASSNVIEQRKEAPPIADSQTGPDQETKVVAPPEVASKGHIRPVGAKGYGGFKGKGKE